MKKKKSPLVDQRSGVEASTASSTESSAATRHGHTGIDIAGIWLSECFYEDLGFKEFVGDAPVSKRTEGDEMNVEPRIEVWSSDTEPGEAFVRLTVSVQPATQPSFHARVAYVGHYTASKDAVIPLREFAWGNGTAYLVPFVRAKLAALTQGSHYPAFFLDPINLDELDALSRVPAENQ